MLIAAMLIIPRPAGGGLPPPEGWRCASGRGGSGLGGWPVDLEDTTKALDCGRGRDPVSDRTSCDTAIAHLPPSCRNLAKIRARSGKNLQRTQCFDCGFVVMMGSRKR